MTGEEDRGKYAVDQREQEVRDKADQKAYKRKVEPALGRGIGRALIRPVFAQPDDNDAEQVYLCVQYSFHL